MSQSTYSSTTSTTNWSTLPPFSNITHNTRGQNIGVTNGQNIGKNASLMESMHYKNAWFYCQNYDVGSV